MKISSCSIESGQSAGMEVLFALLPQNHGSSRLGPPSSGTAVLDLRLLGHFCNASAYGNPKKQRIKGGRGWGQGCTKHFTEEGDLSPCRRPSNRANNPPKILQPRFCRVSPFPAPPGGALLGHAASLRSHLWRGLERSHHRPRLPESASATSPHPRCLIYPQRRVAAALWMALGGGGGDGDGGTLPGSEQKRSSGGHGADVAVPEVDGISISLPAAASQVFQAKLLIAFGNRGVGRKVLYWVFGAGASVPFWGSGVGGLCDPTGAGGVGLAFGGIKGCFLLNKPLGMAPHTAPSLCTNP